MAAAAQDLHAAGGMESLVRPSHDERARQGLVAMLRKLAMNELRAGMRGDWERRVQPALAARGEAGGVSANPDWREIERAMEPELSQRFYSTVRYHSQEMAYQSVIPAVERALPDLIGRARALSGRRPAGGSLRLQPGLDLPRYLTALDVHLAPGSFHSEHVADDVAQGAVVLHGGQVLQAIGSFRRRAGAVGDSIAYWVSRTRPGFAPRRILDMATTSGRNLLPYARHFPAAELHGIDLAAPALRYGHALAEEAGVAVHFSQQDASATDFPGGHFDLIVSTFFLHEIPLKVTREVLRECRRLLAPGGLMLHMELPNEAAASAWDNFFWNWDTANNNEPHYTRFRAEDPLSLCEQAGFARDAAFTARVPEHTSFGEERYARYLRGELEAPQHGAGAWFVFGAGRDA